MNVGKALLFSPVVGFVLSALLLLVMKMLVRQRELYRAPETDKPPAWWIRGLLIFTCTGVSFTRGSNDGQKGMRLIMLILIGMVPTAYALNRASAEARSRSSRPTLRRRQKSSNRGRPGTTLSAIRARG
jgi:inorganic phosphate transporter, PiT family